MQIRTCLVLILACLFSVAWGAIGSQVADALQAVDAHARLVQDVSDNELVAPIWRGAMQ